MRFTQDYEYSWHTLGHAERHGVSQVARRAHLLRLLRRENLLRSDLSISVGSLGSLLDHTGLDRRARKVRRTRVRCPSHVLRDERHLDVESRDLHGRRRGDQIALCDRNCQSRSSTASSRPARSRSTLTYHYAIVTETSVRFRRSTQQGSHQEGHRREPLVPKDGDKRPVHAVITNSTYDGLCYIAAASRSCSIRASIASTSTKPGTRTRASTRSIAIASACTAIPRDHKGPTVFTTHLDSQAARCGASKPRCLHIPRRPQRDFRIRGFNESTTCCTRRRRRCTSIIVSNDITCAMMDGPGGPTLTTESIQEAVSFRQTLSRVHRQFAGTPAMVLQDLERRRRHGQQHRQEGRVRRRVGPAAHDRSRTAGVLHPGER